MVHHDAHYDYWSNSYLPAYDETLGSADAWTSDYEYDAQGHLQQVTINDGQPRTVSYVTNLMGEVMKRDVSFTSGATAAPHELHYYLAGMAGSRFRQSRTTVLTGA